MRRVLVRVTPGVEAETHEAIRTGSPRLEVRARRRTTRSRRVRAARTPGSRSKGCTSTSARSCARRARAPGRGRVARRVRGRCRDELGWTPALVDVGGGSAIRTSRTSRSRRSRSRAARSSARSSREWELARAADAAARPRAGPVARRAARRSRSTASARSSARASGAYVAIDGGMSDNPRPQLYGARYTALLANRADERAGRRVHDRGQALRVGRRLIERVRAARAAPRRPARRSRHRRLHARDGLELQRRPAAGRGARRDGEARVILRRETIDDLLSREPVE